MNIIANDLLSFFNDEDLEPIKSDYIQFSKSLNESKQGEQMNFWKSFLNENVSILETDYDVVDVNNFESGYFEKIYKNGSKIISHLVKTTKCSPLAIFLHNVAFRIRERYQDFNSDIRIGFPKDLRNDSESFKIVGFFVNTLVIQISSTDGIPEIEEKIRKLDQFSTFNFEKVSPEISKERNLFDVMVVCDNSPSDSQTDDKISHHGFRILKTMSKNTKFPLTIFFQTINHDLKIGVEYQKVLWKQETIDSLVDWMIQEEFEPTKNKISEKREELVSQFFDERDISTILNEKFHKFSKNVAFQSESESITYFQLEEKVMNIAKAIEKLYLEKTGLSFRPDTVVPVIAKKSINQWIICLGIIFAGGAYLSIDETNPDGRIAEILNQMKSQFVISSRRIENVDEKIIVDNVELLSQSEIHELKKKASVVTDMKNFKKQSFSTFGKRKASREELEFLKREKFRRSISQDNSTLFNFPSPKKQRKIPVFQQPVIDFEFKAKASTSHLAYVIFTSGTTGKPKGVCINRLGISNMIADAQTFFSIDENSVIYQFTNFCFDNSVLEVFAGLGSGATVFCPTEDFTIDEFVKQIDDYGITHAMLFPGLVETFEDFQLEKMKRLKCWICGAEKLPKNLFNHVGKLGLKVIQNYGPTETTAYCLRKKMKITDDPQNLGKPVQNAKVTIRRPDKKETMTNSKGELYVASVGLTRGYVGKTDQPFVTFVND
uniref:AMP-dependent synthetase/ligase domain-containing protein n=1 Tax=Panagrolaimus sp. JU765 TaxID=591449 RepID=A0AC34RA70_9BILA